MDKVDNESKSVNKNKTDNAKTIRVNGLYSETINNKKSVLSRYVVPTLVSILCLVLSVCAIILTIIIVDKQRNTISELPLIAHPTADVQPTNGLPAEIQTDNEKNKDENNKNEPSDSESTITTYKEIIKIEVLPFIADSSISDAVENILPSLAYLRCVSLTEDGTYITETTALIISDDGYMVVPESSISHLCIDGQTDFESGSYIEVYVNYDHNVKYMARVEGRNKTLNVALLKINNAGTLKYAEYADNENLMPGETVIAASSGNSTSKGQITTGVISGLSYTYKDAIIDQDETPTEELYMISTTAVMNVNNNGGALVNTKGEVIALTVYNKDKPSGLYSAIPIDRIKEAVLEFEVAHYQQLMLANMGIGILNDMCEIPVSQNPEEQTASVCGVHIGYVGFSTPAFQSGLMVNDIITHINGETFENCTQFMEIKNSYKVGENILLTVYRPEPETDDYVLLNIEIIQEAVK